MKDNIVNAFNNFQIADLDHDMIGMCKALVDWLQILRNEIPDEALPVLEKPDNYFKLDPHLPRMELRSNARDFLAAATKKQKEEIDFNIKVKNLYVGVCATAVIYHMPIEKIIEASNVDVEFTREDAKQMLLDNNMSPNWVKEPSGKDFSAIML